MANFISSLSGQALNDALLQVEARIPEGWAVGTYDGVAVSSSSPYYHNNAKYYAALARSAVPSGTSGALFWNVDQSATLSNADKALARKNIMAGGSNPNLVVNPFFQWNQRGKTTYGSVAKEYAFDGWRCGSQTGYRVTKNSDGSITITKTAGATGDLYQFIYNGPFYDDYYTASVMDGDGNIYSATSSRVGADVRGTVTINGVSVDLVVHTSISSTLSLQIYTSSETSGTFTLKAAKLEKGRFSTLANDAKPPKQGIPNDLLYRYEKIENTTGNTMTIGMGYAISTSRLIVPIKLFPKRVVPTVTTTGELIIGATSFLSGGITLGDLALNPATGDGNYSLYDANARLTAGSAYRVMLGNNAKIEFNAEITS